MERVVELFLFVVVNQRWFAPRLSLLPSSLSRPVCKSSTRLKEQELALDAGEAKFLSEAYG